jgi:methylmalonyl-CoA/ethylmalonyl-CoA epimerase
MLKFHHIGTLTESIDDSLEIYQKLFDSGKPSEKIFISSQGVYVCFVEMDGGGLIELVESVDEDSIVARMKKKGFTYYHIGYTVSNIEKTIDELQEMNFKFLNIFNSEAFAGKKCAFLYSPDMHLIELIEE